MLIYYIPCPDSFTGYSSNNVCTSALCSRPMQQQISNWSANYPEI